MTLNQGLTLENLVRFGGLMQLGILTASAITPRVLEWRRQFRPLDPLVRQLVWTYGGYVVLMIASLGLLSLTQAPALLDGSLLARSITGFITTFWSIRLALQFFVFDARPHLSNRFLVIAHHALTVVFCYLTVVFAWATFR